MPNNLYLLVFIKNVVDIFDEFEAKSAYKVIAAFLDLEQAQNFVPLFADICEHGDRIAIFGYDASASEGYSEVTVVVSSEVN